MERVELGRRLGARESATGRVLINESDPLRFQRALANAAAGEGEVFLCDPQWGDSERRQLQEMLETATGLLTPMTPRGSEGWMLVPTGGTSGKLRFARHDQYTIDAAVNGFRAFFQIRRVNAFGLLPLHHVSGLMSGMRCALTHGEYRQGDGKAG